VAISKAGVCKSSKRLLPPQQTLSRSSFCFFVAASHVGKGKGVSENFAVMRQFVVWQKKEGLLGELRWVRGHRILAEECSVARRERPAKVPV